MMAPRGLARHLQRAGPAALAILVATSTVPAGTMQQGPAPTEPVHVRIDLSREQQTIEGFGATHRAAAHGDRDLLDADLRHRALDALYRQVRLTTGNLDAALLESPGSYGERRNDNGKAGEIDWAGFQTSSVDAMKRLVLDRPEAAGFDRFFLAQKINTRWASPWLGELRGKNYSRYVDEAVEQIVAAQIYWRDKHGIVPRYHQLFNEPLGGNEEMRGAEPGDLADIVKKAGQRLRQLGFPDVRFVVPNEVNVPHTLRSAEVILGDRGARPFVGAIGYHPYGDGFGSGHVLALASRGEVDRAAVESRARLRDLAAKHGVHLWITETSRNGLPGFSYQSFVARAIHIHHELLYANASVYMGMNSIWDLTSHREHFGRREGFDGTEGDVVLVDQEKKTVTITGIGYAMGHYARWLTAGEAVRVDAEASDPLVMVTGFRDRRQGRAVAVLVNNAGVARTVSIGIAGGQPAGPIAGEQSTERAYWARLSTAERAGDISVALPPHSVTSIAIPLAASASGR
jgi:O-glycosyl hydrolase